jgi:hypothetical protein
MIRILCRRLRLFSMLRKHIDHNLDAVVHSSGIPSVLDDRAVKDVFLRVTPGFYGVSEVGADGGGAGAPALVEGVGVVVEVDEVVEGGLG